MKIIDNLNNRCNVKTEVKTYLLATFKYTNILAYIVVKHGKEVQRGIIKALVYYKFFFQKNIKERSNKSVWYGIVMVEAKPTLVFIFKIDVALEGFVEGLNKLTSLEVTFAGFLISVVCTSLDFIEVVLTASASLFFDILVTVG